MSIKHRLSKVEQLLSVSKVNVADELDRLKKLALSGIAPKQQTTEDLEQIIAECDNSELYHIYKHAIRAIA